MTFGLGINIIFFIGMGLSALLLNTMTRAA